MHSFTCLFEQTPDVKAALKRNEPSDKCHGHEWALECDLTDVRVSGVKGGGWADKETLMNDGNRYTKSLSSMHKVEQNFRQEESVLKSLSIFSSPSKPLVLKRGKYFQYSLPKQIVEELQAI